MFVLPPMSKWFFHVQTLILEIILIFGIEVCLWIVTITMGMPDQVLSFWVKAHHIPQSKGFVFELLKPQVSIVFIHTSSHTKILNKLKPYKPFYLIRVLHSKIDRNARLEATHPIFHICFFSNLEAQWEQQESPSSSTKPAFLSSKNLQSLLRFLQGTQNQSFSLFS